MNQYLQDKLNFRNGLVDELKRNIETIENEFNKNKVYDSKSLIEKINSYITYISGEAIYKDKTEEKELKNLNLINKMLFNANKIAKDIASQFLYLSSDNFATTLLNALENFSGFVEEEYKRIDYLKVLGNNNMVLLGANGSGKSVFASFMKESQSDKIIVIPAQKLLYFNSDVNNNSIKITRKDYMKIQAKNFNNKKNLDGDYSFSELTDSFKKVFTNTILLTINEYIAGAIEDSRNNNGNNSKCQTNKVNFLEFEELWSKLIPDITWDVDTNERKMVPIKNNCRYSLNAMSDGEKAIIFYILSVLNAEKESYIIIDEPETYLNPSIYKRLWDLLEVKRSDCTFIYISHNIDFVNSRHTHELYWIKNYDGDKNWTIVDLEADSLNLPDELLIEILGAKQPIIFCEGKKSSLDYKVYTRLFESSAVIIPVETCVDVINCTKAYNSLEDKTTVAYGIVDRDHRVESNIKNLWHDNIYTLYFNEIEMFMLSEEILEEVIKNTYPNYREKIDIFKEKIIKIFKLRKNEVIDKAKKTKIDSFLEEHKVDEKKSIEEIISIIGNEIKELNIDGQSETLSESINKACESNNYGEILILSPFKYFFEKETNSLILDYEDSSLWALEKNGDLRKHLLDKYFPELKEKIFGETISDTGEI